MASIKVAIRCRPFTIDDKLGVVLQQNGDEEGEVQLINTDYTTTRFAFTWAWWSAYGYARRVQGSPPEAESMLLVNQDMAYQSTGIKIKNDLLAGNAVVIFAYGLSGSGKTFTVFGPDAIDIPEAWFKHAEPHPLWGIFPRLAYEVFQEKEENWKITMKYFQNVVDIVRDLMSPTAQEKHYKEGMRKDADGFTDIDWCVAQPLVSWNDLRQQFMKANARKAIAPTQFNHQSTRGHCIMTFQVDRPNPDNPDFKYQGRLYVCDLAGTEPAGDIFFARYEKVSYPDGTVDHNLLGPDPDQKKTKELQDQGKKINLSLTEMSQFFMKMAEAVLAKKLKPGMAIPGCNSYFLCKYLKDTMLQARTYLFCAIRPEVTYSNYTFATLGFAKNASVVKLQPKKATVAMSPGEKKLFAELEQMKALVEQLRSQNQQLVGPAAGSGDMVQLQAMLDAKQKELQNAMYTDNNGQNSFDAEEAMLARQKEEYGRRGIDLTHYSSNTSEPFLINLDEDPFRNNRLMYLLTRASTVFGPKSDIQPLSLSVIKNHCTIDRSGDELALIGGAGETFHNGRRLARGERVILQPYDRVAMGSELLLFKHPGKNPESDPPSPSDCFEEYQNALASKGGSDLHEQMAKFEEEKANWEKNKNNNRSSTAVLDMELEEVRSKAMQQVDRDILELLPKVKECKEICTLFNRDYLNFEVTLQKTNDKMGIPRIKVQVHNNKSSETIAMDEFEFVKGFSLLKDELTQMRTALENDREYEVPEHHDPVKLLFDNTFHMGTARLYTEYLIYNMETDAEDKFQEIKNASAPYNKVGTLEVTWAPCDESGNPLDESVSFVDKEEDIIGKPWNARVRIKEATGLPVTTDMAYCQYEFFGETFTTETVEQNTHNPRWDYSFIHHVDRVTPELVEFLKKELEIHVFISPYVLPSKDKITTHNPRVLEKLGFQHLITPEMATSGSSVFSPGATNKGDMQRFKELEDKLQASENEKQELITQVNSLLSQVADLTRQVETLRGRPPSPRPKQGLSDAVTLDKALNAGAK